MGDSHAWAAMYTWNPRIQLSALLKRNKQAVAYAKHMVNNLRGWTDLQCLVSQGKQLCMGGILMMIFVEFCGVLTRISCIIQHSWCSLRTPGALM